MNDTNFRTILSSRIGISEIYEILVRIENDERQKTELYKLLFSEDETTAYQTAWVLMHLNKKERVWLFDKQDELIDAVLVCYHPGKRRLLLNLLLHQPIPTSPRIDFLDFCLERMISKEELPGVQTLCMKIAHNMCRNIPELLQEFRLILDMMEPDLLPKSIQAVHRNVLKAMKNGKRIM